MINERRALSFLFYLMSLFIFICPSSVFAEFELPSTINVEPQRQGEKDKEVKTVPLSIDELLGPEDMFPFLPENHRDNSSPVGGISH